MSGGSHYISRYGMIDRDIAIGLRTGCFCIPAHWHSALEITFLISGQAGIIIEGTPRAMAEGEFAVIDSELIHECRCPGDCTQLVIHIRDDYISSFVEERSGLRIVCDRTQLSDDQILPYREICGALEEILRHYSDRPFGYRIRCESIVLQILFLLISRFSVRLHGDGLPESSKERRRIREIVAYVAENYDRPLTLEEISGHFGLNSEYFSRLFAQQIGIPFKKHLNQVRLSHIHHDLCATDAPIMELAYRHGFTNYKLFNRMFRETYGAPPRELRRRIAHPDKI